MYQGRHLTPQTVQSSPKSRRRYRRRAKPFIVFVSVLVLLIAAAVGTMAFIKDKSVSIVNTFTPPTVDVTIDEDVTTNTKSNIVLTNPAGENAVDAYLRGTLVVYWKDTIEGQLVTVSKPEGASVIVGGPGVGWIQVGEIFYYCSPVKPGESTTAMNTGCTVTLPPGSTAQCIIDVRAEAIQATPASAVEDAWKDVNVVNGLLVSAG